MDYEQKYNEALKWMRELYPGLHGATKEDAEHYFPELRESEDERIRKEIIDIVESYRRNCVYEGTHRFDECIAWLEKQKINTEGDFSRGYDCGYQAGYAVAMNEMKPKVATATLATLDSEKQEQKPVENPKWTELTWKDIVELEGIINNVHYDFRNGIGQESFGKEVLERFRNTKDDADIDSCEQMPADWTDKDKRIIDDVSKLLITWNYKDMARDYKKAVEKLLKLK